MIIEMRKNGKKLGTIIFSPEGKLSFVGESDETFKAFVDSLVAAGVPRLIDVSNEENNSLTIIEQTTQQTDPNFPLALKEHLERSGYEVIEKHPEIEEKITKLLAEFPDDNPDKKDILKRLPGMSYLEQSTILEGLLALNNPDNELK